MPGPVSQSYEGPRDPAPPPVVTCDGLRSLVEPDPAARVGVLMVLADAPGKPNGEIQFVTWGRRAEDKSEAHNLKEWVKRKVFGGDVPDARTHESFILDAAKNREELDQLRAAARALVMHVYRLSPDDHKIAVEGSNEFAALERLTKGA